MKEFYEVTPELDAQLDKARELRGKVESLESRGLSNDANLLRGSLHIVEHAVVTRLLSIERTLAVDTTTVDIAAVVEEVVVEKVQDAYGMAVAICHEAMEIGESVSWVAQRVAKEGNFLQALKAKKLSEPPK